MSDSLIGLDIVQVITSTQLFNFIFAQTWKLVILFFYQTP